jgi:hypothetical protein
MYKARQINFYDAFYQLVKRNVSIINLDHASQFSAIVFQLMRERLSIVNAMERFYPPKI